MTLEYAIKLLRRETREEEMEKLRYYNGFNMDKIIGTMNEAIELVCDYAERYEELNK